MFNVCDVLQECNTAIKQDLPTLHLLFLLQLVPSIPGPPHLIPCSPCTYIEGPLCIDMPLSRAFLNITSRVHSKGTLPRGPPHWAQRNLVSFLIFFRTHTRHFDVGILSSFVGGIWTSLWCFSFQSSLPGGGLFFGARFGEVGVLFEPCDSSSDDDGDDTASDVSDFLWYLTWNLWMICGN